MSCIIIGASHAGVQAAINLRGQGYEGEITLISADAVLPYQRPPLSKAFFQDTLPEQRLWLRPENFYRTKNIDLRLNTRVTSINREQKEVALDSGETLTYHTLILATGAAVNRLSIAGSNLPGIHYLRDHNDTVGLRASLPDVDNVVVIGGGYIGLEAAASLAKLGKNVTVLLNQERPLRHLTSEVVSTHLTTLHQRHGVTIQPLAGAQEITGEDHVTGVLASNGQHYPADIVVVGIGVSPAQNLAQACGLDVANGIVVNEYMQTSDNDIYAIGDCVSFYHPTYKKQLRIESVQNATDQSKTAAMAICGKRISYEAMPWFWSDQYDAKLQIVGLSDGYTDTVVRKESETSIAVFYFLNERLIAVEAINQPKSFMIARKHIQDLPELDKTRLADINQDLNLIFTELVGA